MLIRKGFVELAIKGQYSSDAGKARELMKRMLRRVKGSSPLSPTPENENGKS